MPNPVQIILNDADFHRAPEPGQPPRNKDFFENADDAFAAHKAALLAAVDAITAAIRTSPFGPAAYLKVQMRDQALAKSYRPGWIFKRDQFPCVGAEAVGTLYFRAPLIFMSALRDRINTAELKVEIKRRLRDGEPYKAPTVARAEVGAIYSIEIAPPDAKRTFSIAAALASFQDPRAVSGYQIELFETPRDNVIASDRAGHNTLRRTLGQLLLQLGTGARSFLNSPIGRTPILELQLTRGTQPALVNNRTGLTSSDLAVRPESAPIDLNADRHEAVLNKLQEHPLVRAILPPVLLQLTDAETGVSNPSATPLFIPGPVANATYPIVGVIDSGVGDSLKEWVVGRFDFLSEDEFDAIHGTGVAGLISMGQLINPPAIAPETNGCRIFDIPLFPSGNFSAKYPMGFTDFLEEIEQAVAEATQEHDVRVFNLSINAVSDVERHRYSIYASRLDQIADAFGVIFVNSAGNLPPQERRVPWPKRPIDVVRYFASRTLPDTIFKPSESVRSIAVGALNPPGTHEIADAPTTYTTRGSGLGVKPDVATYGGIGSAKPGAPSGLSSISPDGLREDVAGTSFSAPLVARSLAGLDAATRGGLTTEALRAMLLHHATMPEPLTRRGLKDIPRQFAGFGKPASVVDMLETGEHQITLLFQSRLSIGERKPVILHFPFIWPQSLTAPNSACSGRARITLVYSPPLDPAFGAEFIRVNLEAALKQRQPEPDKAGNARFLNQIDACYLPGSAKRAIPEKALIDHGLKWWPSKQYGSTFEDHGSSSEWCLEVTSLVRAEAEFPADGVPFAVLLTLEDPDGTKPVFQELRQYLQSSIANAQDVRTAIRARNRL
ncbi:S8 family peptidase [Azospirillum sp. BE72]|uniref:S8 family peptidase n=1 Tax=Azospirillum sp. BE72 TaxID=2817776 RepID=UPI00285514D9|nr:S8 family peptidase [Azospirillum sp. BE72]MDR6773317.1 hypothetical protein [Azospirillum sp. BE72]